VSFKLVKDGKQIINIDVTYVHSLQIYVSHNTSGVILHNLASMKCGPEANVCEVSTT